MGQTTTFTSTMSGAIWQAQKIVENTFISYNSKFFIYPKNANIHIDETAEEICHKTDGTVYILVLGVGIGGTITSISEVIKIHKPNFQAISPKGMRFAYAVEAISSPVLSRGSPESHQMQKIGASFVSQILKMELIERKPEGCRRP